MEGVYLLRSNGTITSLLGTYSKNFEQEAFKEFGDKTKQFGHLFETDFVKICNRKVFSFDVTEVTRLSFVFNKDHLSLTENPTPSQLFTLAFKSFTSKLIPKSNSSLEGEEHVTFDPEARITQKSVNTADELSLTCLFRSSELLLRLAFDYENYVTRQPDPVFPTLNWENMLTSFKDEIRIAAVRSSCRLAAQLCTVQDQIANVRQALETSRYLQNEHNEGIEVLTTALQTLSLQLGKTEQKDALISTQQSKVAFTPPTPAIDSNIPVTNTISRTEEKNLRSENKSTDSEERHSKGSSNQRELLSTDSNPVAEDKNVRGANELEKLLSASKNAIFYLQRDLAAMKLERDSYYHQILELRRARQIYETKRHQEMTEIVSAEPKPSGKKKPKENGTVVTANGKTNTLNGQEEQRKGWSGQAGQRIGPILKTKIRGEEL